MARKTYQYRFQASNNGVSNITNSNDLVTGAAFNENFSKGVEQIGIQALPGTRFKMSTGPDWVIIGTTGIYELDLTGRATIGDLSFDKASIDIISQTKTPLLVDIVYKEED
jgi:hypothetical protein